MISKKAVLLQARMLDKHLLEFAKSYTKQVDDQCVFTAIAQIVDENGKFNRQVQTSYLPSHMAQYRRILLVTPGNGYLSTVEAVCQCLLFRPEKLYILPSQRDEFGIAFMEYMSEKRYPMGVLVSSSHEEKLGTASQLEVDAAVLYGSDETIAEYTKVLPNSTKIISYGTKLSIGYHANVETLFKKVREYAEDFFLYNGTGCLNTSALYVKVNPEEPKLYESQLKTVQEFAEKLAERRVYYMTNFPGMQVSQTIQAQLLRSDSAFTQHNGIFVRDPSRSVTEPPITGGGLGTGMIVLVTGIADIEWEWQDYESDLSSCTYSDKDRGTGLHNEEIMRLFELGVTRVTSPGSAQWPSHRWCHDGYPPIPPLYRNISVDTLR